MPGTECREVSLPWAPRRSIKMARLLNSAVAGRLSFTIIMLIMIKLIMSSRWCVNVSKLGLQQRKLNCVRVRRNCMQTCLRARKAAPHQICTDIWVVVFPVTIFYQTSRFEVKDSKHVQYRRQPWHSLTWDVKNGSYLHSDCEIIWAVNCIEQPRVGGTPRVVGKGELEIRLNRFPSCLSHFKTPPSAFVFIKM